MANVASSSEGARESSPPGTTARPALTTSPSTSILGNFLRGRPRNASQSHIVVDAFGLGNHETSPSPPSPARRRAHGASPTIPPSMGNEHARAANVTGAGGLSGMLRRRRSAGHINSTASSANPPTQPQPVPTPSTMPPQTNANNNNNNNSQHTHRIRLVPHLDSRRSLRFDPITRTLKPEDPPLKIGRFTDRTGLGLAAVNAISNNKLAFKSKVVSRTHAEISIEQDATGAIKFFIKDTKSSSGTFLNHLRLSPANIESRKFELHDGDLLQLGVDYQGGTEDIYKSVKIRIELGAGREWQAGANAFNTNAMKNLKTLASGVTPASNNKVKQVSVSKGAATSTQGIPDCCICLFAVSIRQALFIAPCSHTFHYKCIRPLLEQHHPAFSCPLCRTYADLEEDVEIEQEEFLVSTSSDPGNPPNDFPMGGADGKEEGATHENGDLRAAIMASEVLAAAHSGGGAAGGGRDVVTPTSGERGAETEVEDFPMTSNHPHFGATGTLLNHSRFRSGNSHTPSPGAGTIAEDHAESGGSGEEDERMVVG